MKQYVTPEYLPIVGREFDFHRLKMQDLDWCLQANVEDWIRVLYQSREIVTVEVTDTGDKLTLRCTWDVTEIHFGAGRVSVGKDCGEVIVYGEETHYQLALYGSWETEFEMLVNAKGLYFSCPYNALNFVGDPWNGNIPDGKTYMFVEEDGLYRVDRLPEGSYREKSWTGIRQTFSLPKLKSRYEAAGIPYVEIPEPPYLLIL